MKRRREQRFNKRTADDSQKQKRKDFVRYSEVLGGQAITDSDPDRERKIMASLKAGEISAVQFPSGEIVASMPNPASTDAGFGYYFASMDQFKNWILSHIPGATPLFPLGAPTRKTNLHGPMPSLNLHPFGPGVPDDAALASYPPVSADACEVIKKRLAVGDSDFTHVFYCPHFGHLAVEFHVVDQTAAFAQWFRQPSLQDGTLVGGVGQAMSLILTALDLNADLAAVKAWRTCLKEIGYDGPTFFIDSVVEMVNERREPFTAVLYWTMDTVSDPSIQTAIASTSIAFLDFLGVS